MNAEKDDQAAHSAGCSLDDSAVRSVLDRVSRLRVSQRPTLWWHVARSLLDRSIGREPTLDEEVRRLARFTAAVSPKQGRFLYLVARSIRARQIVEYGTSVGISTIHLAAAVRDNGGGRVIGTELDPHKAAIAREHLTAAGLADLVELRQGNALVTLANLDAEIDLIFLDGYPPLYLDILRMLGPHLRTGAVVVADNILTHHRLLRPYREFVRDPRNGFRSETLFMRYGVEYSVRL